MKFLAQFPAAIRQAPLTLAYHTGAEIRPAIIGWAILPPGDRQAATDNSR